MSITRRFVNLAKANLNALLDRVAESDPAESARIDRMTDEELEAELLRRRDRRERDEEMRRAREEAERAARARQGAQAAGGSASERPGTAAGGAARPRGSADPSRLAQLYAQLEVPVGADLPTIKAAYRRLMRKYHPDNFSTDPKKAAVATELTQKLSQAYRELEAILKGTPPHKRM
jgi:DnaJ-domain-containing protein 1